MSPSVARRSRPEGALGGHGGGGADLLALLGRARARGELHRAVAARLREGKCAAHGRTRCPGARWPRVRVPHGGAQPRGALAARGTLPESASQGVCLSFLYLFQFCFGVLFFALAFFVGC